MPQWITPEECAKRLGVSPQRIYTLLRAGRIPGARKVGSKWRGSWHIPLHDDGSVGVIPTRRPFDHLGEEVPSTPEQG
jgi:excisionase family DNA binding protein